MRRRERPQRLLMIIGSGRVGGAEQQMTRLACELRQRGHDVEMLLTHGGGPLTARLDAAGVPWEVAFRENDPRRWSVKMLAGFSRLAWLVAKRRPDVVCAWLPTAVWMGCLSAMFLTRARRVVGFRGEVFERDLGLQRWLFRWAVASADLVTVNSPTLVNEAVRWGARGSRVKFIPNGVDTPDYVADPTPSPPVGVVVANFRWYKGHDTLVEAVARVADRPFMIRLCGEGEGRERIESMAENFGVSHKIIFVPHPADIPAELSAAQFAVHPSTTEGLSNAILEQMSAGLPVVATDVGGTALLIEDGVTGHLVPHSRADRLAEAIERVVSDAEYRTVLGKAARAKSQEFSWATCTDRYEAIFDRSGAL